MVVAAADGAIQDQSDRRLVVLWLTVLVAFLVAFIIWWVLYEYQQSPSQVYGLGLWSPVDRPSWLPLHSSYHPLIGKHYFGDFFQLYYSIRSGAPYTGHIVRTALNPGYLFPIALISWLPYPAGGFIYIGVLFVTWTLPAFTIASRSRLLALLYLMAATLSVPGLLALDIGQPEIFVYVLAVFALLLIERRPQASAILLGLAIAIKPYMAIFVLLYLFRRQNRQMCIASIVAIVVNLATALALVPRLAFTWHFWLTILRGSLGYGSGSGQVLWGGQPFLRSNASLFALLDVVRGLRLPLLSRLALVCAQHYSVVSLVLVFLAFWIIRKTYRMLTIEAQWLLLAAIFLLIPSFTIAYAWLLLFVPFVAVACGGVGSNVQGSELPRIALLQSRGIMTLVALLVVPYPENLSIPRLLTSGDPMFAPNGNTLVTPICLVAIVVLFVLMVGSRRSRRHARYASIVGRARHRQRVAATGRVASEVDMCLQQIDHELGGPLVSALALQFAVVLVALAISWHLNVAQGRPRHLIATEWTGRWQRSPSEIAPGASNSFTVYQSGHNVFGTFPWPGCGGSDTFSGQVSGVDGKLIFSGSRSEVVGSQSAEVGSVDVHLAANGRVMVGTWRIAHTAFGCIQGQHGLFDARRPGTNGHHGSASSGG